MRKKCLVLEIISLLLATQAQFDGVTRLIQSRDQVEYPACVWSIHIHNFKALHEFMSHLFLVIIFCHHFTINVCFSQ